MTPTTHLSIAARVSEGEEASLRLAGERLARVLRETSAAAWSCESVFVRDLAMLERSDAAIAVISFFSELENRGEPWSSLESRLRTACAALTQGDRPVFLCTILRHVGREEEGQRAAELRIRIRQLNLLVAGISRETGAYVIDLDRALADVGARKLQTDYRLGGPAAALAAHTMALTLINNLPGERVPFELQDAVRAALLAHPPSVDNEGAKAEVTFRKHLLSMVHEGRKVTVAPVVYSVQENHADWLIRQVLRGTIRPADALRRLGQAVQRNGLRESLRRLGSAVSRQIIRQKK